jgi:predicted small integral membrane protein
MIMNLNLSWMAWTWPTAVFFVVVALLLVGMGAWEYVSPGGNPRTGILRFETTRGDRLFVSMLGAAFITLAWLGLVGPNLWWALARSVVYAIGVLRLV